MITYLPNDPNPGGKYGLSYRELRDDYIRYRLLPDDEFIAQLPQILHFACFVCYVKEIGSDRALSDEGIVHELVHLMNFGVEGICPPLRKDVTPYTLRDLEKIRDLFNRDCCLA